jgi:hypothetical protein
VDEVVKSCRRKNMLFFTEVERHVAEADIGCVFVNTSTDTEAGAADVNEEPKVPAKVKYEEVWVARSGDGAEVEVRAVPEAEVREVILKLSVGLMSTPLLSLLNTVLPLSRL